MKRKWARVLVFLLLGHIYLYLQEVEKNIIEKYCDVLYPVRYQYKHEFFPGMVREGKKYAIGLALKENLIVISYAYFEQISANLAVVGGIIQPQAQERRRNIPEVVYVIVDEKNEHKAKLIGENKDLKIVYYQLVDETKKLKFLNLEKGEDIRLSIGDSVLICDRLLLLKEYNFPYKVKKRSIEMVLEKPYLEYLIEESVPQMGLRGFNPLALVFNTKGRLIGIISLSQNVVKEGSEERVPDDHEEIERRTLKMNLLMIKPLSFLDDVYSKIPVVIKTGWIGFFKEGLEFITNEEAEEFLKIKKEQKGLRIASLPEDGPAYKSGLREGDIILNIGDIDCIIKEIKDLEQIMDKLAKLEVGKEIKVKFLRKEEKGDYTQKEVTVTIEEKPPSFEEVEEYEDKKLGIKVKELTVDYKYKNKLPLGQKGLVVTFVKPQGPASVAGIIASDILLSLTPQGDKEYEVNTISELKNVSEICSKSQSKEVIAKILSSKETKLLTLRNINWDSDK
ncbi:MAG: PDZ domain-containing protein [Planctomycetota bacterium]